MPAEGTRKLSPLDKAFIGLKILVKRPMLFTNVISVLLSFGYCVQNSSDGKSPTAYGVWAKDLRVPLTLEPCGG